jgi:energy-coupling factor transporter ATP-binding protein EcfA2
VILADEPTGNLDSRSSEEIGTILRSLAAEQGVTVILVTHADNVAGWAHRRLAMRDGQLSDRADSEWKAPTVPAHEAPAPTAPAPTAPAPETLAAVILAAELSAEAPAEPHPDPAP